MFNIWLGYTSFEDEKLIAKNTTSDSNVKIETVLTGEEIVYFQRLIRKVPINDNVIDYAVRLVSKTRPGTELAHPYATKYLQWGAGPRASQYLVIGAKAHALINGKYSPDIEDVQAVAESVLRHRIVRNYKAEADNLSAEAIIKELMK